MIAVQDWLEEKRLGALLVMQVHDELVLEVPEPELARVQEGLRSRMQDVARLEVPLIVDMGVGANWDQSH
jgi:DNA polymerase-1